MTILQHNVAFRTCRAQARAVKEDANGSYPELIGPTYGLHIPSYPAFKRTLVVGFVALRWLK